MILSLGGAPGRSFMFNTVVARPAAGVVVNYTDGLPNSGESGTRWSLPFAPLIEEESVSPPPASFNPDTMEIPLAIIVADELNPIIGDEPSLWPLVQPDAPIQLQLVPADEAAFPVDEESITAPLFETASTIALRSVEEEAAFPVDEEGVATLLTISVADATRLPNFEEESVTIVVEEAAVQLMPLGTLLTLPLPQPTDDELPFPTPPTPTPTPPSPFVGGGGGPDIGVDDQLDIRIWADVSTAPLLISVATAFIYAAAQTAGVSADVRTAILGTE
jgi:hypothetical protein